MPREFKFDNMDAAESIFFARQLELIEARAYEIKRQPLKATQLVPTQPVEDWVDTITYRMWDQFGMAKWISAYADDLPRADIKAEETTSKMKAFGVSYGYSIDEIRKAMHTGVALDAMKAAAARRAHDEFLDNVITNGDAAHDLTGFLNLSNTTTYVTPNGSNGDTEWTSKNPDEILDDMHGIANGMVASTSEVEAPDTLVLPLDQYTYVATKKVGIDSPMTILQMFLATSPYIKTVIPWAKLAGAGAGGSDRMVCYRRDPEVVYAPVRGFMQMPPQQRNMEFVINCDARSGGVICRYPLAVSYGDHI